jgi:hypothetical protein
MASRLEAILSALMVKLERDMGLKVLRNSPLPTFGPTGVLILHDGDPGDPEVTMSPLLYHYIHEAELDVFTQGENRQARFEEIKTGLAALLDEDRTLGGLCDWIEAGAPVPEDIHTQGAAVVKSAAIALRIHYATPDPLI